MRWIGWSAAQVHSGPACRQRIKSDPLRFIMQVPWRPTGGAMSSLTGRVFGYYHILDRIGQGGMGAVYRALDRKAGREVAVKFISPAIAQQEVFLNRFLR